MTLLNPQSVTPDSLPSIDDIIVCGSCRVPSVVTVLATRLLTDAEVASMPAEVRADISFALRNLKAKLSQS